MLIVALMGSPRSNAGSPYYQWQLTLGNNWVSGWQADAESTCAAGQAAAQANPTILGLNTSGAETFPSYGCNITAEIKMTSCTTGTCWDPWQSGAYQITPRTNTGWYFVSARPPTPLSQGHCDTCVAEPINPASAAVFATGVDAKEHGAAAAFERFYNSANSSTGDLGTAWRHSFSRGIAARYSSTSYRPYVQSDPDYSSLYNDATSACTNGFAEIRGRISTWQNASASYANGTCALSVGAMTIGTLPVNYSSTLLPAPLPILVGFDATRDDGQVISFSVQGSSIAAPPSTGLKLQQTGSGYALTDERDIVEAYDAKGKLLSVTTRAGVVQTMSYDSSGRLGAVTDSFGHSLSLSYDGQGRISSSTCQRLQSGC